MRNICHTCVLHILTWCEKNVKFIEQLFEYCGLYLTTHNFQWRRLLLNNKKNITKENIH